MASRWRRIDGIRSIVGGVFMLGFAVWLHFEDVELGGRLLTFALLGVFLVLFGCWILLRVAERGQDEEWPRL